MEPDQPCLLALRAPANLVFIAPNTFTMGSPTNDFDRSSNEIPQTTVTLTRGYWIGKFEVTQGEYLALTGENPSNFPGELNRPVSSVTWFDATNYCWKLTQRELAAGRIPPGSRFRLPTEAEWECASRLSFPATHTDTDLGFRVVFVIGLYGSSKLRTQSGTEVLLPDYA
jgi:formylglycine-generating enzyme required for sulfatase activity